MIIVEGPDNTGKTTLIEQLAKEFRLPMVKSYRPRTSGDIIRFHNWVKACPATVILDRHPSISDFIYGNIIRGDSPSDPDLIQFLREGHYLVFCDPPTDTILSTYSDRPQMEGTHENIQRIISEYRSLMATIEPDFVYDFTQPKAFKALAANLQRALGRI